MESSFLGPSFGKYMVLEFQQQILDFPINGENIIVLVHYVLFTFSLPRLPFNGSMLAASCLQVHKKGVKFT